MKKLDKDFIKQEFEKQGYTLLEEYQNSHKPINLLTKDGYKCSLSYIHLYDSKPILFGKRCKFQEENIRLLISKKNSNVQYIKHTTKTHNGKLRTFVTMKCECGNIFTKQIEHVKNDKYLLCEKCTRKLERQERKQKYNNKYLKNIQKSKYQLIDKNQDLYANQGVEVIDTETQFRGYINPNRLHRKMLVFSLHHNKNNYIYNVNVLLNKYGCKTKALELVNNDKDIRFVCECGKEYIANNRSVESGKFYCDECTNRISQYELLFKKYLDNIKEEYIREYRFNGCEDIIPLPFDFYLKRYDVLVEIDGRQHRYDSYTIAHDKTKNEYCKKHNIPLLRIWYEDIINGKYTEIFEEFIKPFRD